MERQPSGNAFLIRVASWYSSGLFAVHRTSSGKDGWWFAQLAQTCDESRRRRGHHGPVGVYGSDTLKLMAIQVITMIDIDEIACTHICCKLEFVEGEKIALGDRHKKASRPLSKSERTTRA